MKASVNAVQDPPVARFLFSDTRIAIIWLLVRVYVGYQWFEAGWEKFQGTGWMDTGKSLLGFWQKAVAVPATGKPAITYDWYRNFLQFLIDTGSYSWFAKLVVLGEMLVGIGLIVGALVGVAAFFGALMNFNFMLAGSASSNPMLFFLAILLMLAWKTAGYYGLDRWLLLRLGTPWQPVSELVAKPKPTSA